MIFGRLIKFVFLAFFNFAILAVVLPLLFFMFALLRGALGF